MESRVLLRAENLSYNLTADKTLFRGINVSIQTGDRIALVGPTTERLDPALLRKGRVDLIHEFIHRFV